MTTDLRTADNCYRVVVSLISGHHLARNVATIDDCGCFWGSYSDQIGASVTIWRLSDCVLINS